MELSPDRLIVLLRSDDLRVKEVDLWNAVVRWAKAQIRTFKTKDKDLKTVLAPIVPFIRFPLFTVQEFATYVQGAGVLSQEQLLALYTYIAQRESKVPKKHLPKVPFSSEPRAATSFQFSWARCGTYGNIDETKMRFNSNGSGYCCVLGNTPIKPKSGQYYWEVKVLSGGTNADYSMAVGVATQALAMDNYLSSTAAGWAYFCHGVRAHAGADNNNRYGQRFGTGDTIGVLFDSDAGTISCYRNRVPIGVMYDNIFELIYPAAMCNGNASMQLLEDVTMPAI